MQTRALSGLRDQQTETDIWSTRLEVFDKVRVVLTSYTIADLCRSSLPFNAGCKCQYQGRFAAHADFSAG